MGDIRPNSSVPAPPGHQRLESWKEIAAYLGREVRTVQRWEAEEGLPVHRHPHKKLGTVHAFRPEIDIWMRDRKAVLEKEPLGPASTRSRQVLWVLAGLVVGAAGVSIAWWRLARPGELHQSLQVEIALPPQTTLMNGPSLALSPDGRRLALAASGGLWLRNLDETGARLVPGTSDAIAPFWSPDGREIAFFAGGKLKKLAFPDGIPETLCDAPDPQGAAWSQKGVIVFAPNLEGPLFRIAAAGGRPTPVTQLDAARQEYLHSAPSFLPGGERFLYHARGAQGANDAVVLGSLESSGGKPARLFSSASGALYSPGARSERGHVLFFKEGNLAAQAFDLKTHRLSGAVGVVARRIRYWASGVMDLGLSKNDLLVYAQEDLRISRPKWIGRHGSHLGEVGEPGEYKALRLSPNQRKLASVRINASDLTGGIWCLDLVRGVDTKLAGGVGMDDPTWTPDSAHLVFTWERNEAANLYRLAVTGSPTPEALLPAGRDRWPLDCSRDGRFLLYAEIDPATKFDVWALPLQGGGAPKPLLRGPGKENEARFSPDGKFIAYQSDESGHVQVYIQTFPPGGGRWQISVDHGAEPRWRGDGRELFYISGDHALMAAPIALQQGKPHPGKPVRLFGGTDSHSGIRVWKYEPSPDGQRFLVLTPSEKSAATPVHLVTSWRKTLK
ncbi:MAG: hypothetical protein AAB225_25715 [Acidobacteriota bacterium]